MTAHLPCRPQPELELLKSFPISVETAERQLSDYLRSEEGAPLEAESLNSNNIKFKQLPSVLETLRSDWVNRKSEEQPAECFVEVHARIEVHLHPSHLGPKLAVGLQRAVGALLLRFDPVLRCVPLTCAQVEPVGTKAAIVGESPYVHFLANFRSVGFAPQREQWLFGRLADVHVRPGINLLILGVINAFVDYRDLPSELLYDESSHRWVHSGGLDLKQLVMWFRATRLHRGSQDLALKGELHMPSGSRAAALDDPPTTSAQHKVHARKNMNESDLVPSCGSSGDGLVPEERGEGVDQEDGATKRRKEKRQRGPGVCSTLLSGASGLEEQSTTSITEFREKKRKKTKDKTRDE